MSLLIAATLAILLQGQSSPWSAELKHIVAQDQADRQFSGKPTPDQIATMNKRDPIRRARVREILSKADYLTGEDFEAAALVFQHGEKPIDFALAHFLSICSNALWRIGSLPALSEDRYLKTVHRRQRFGTQFSFAEGGDALDPVDEAKPTALTDDMRADFLVPALKDSETLGLEANKSVASSLDRIFARRHLPGSPNDDAASPSLNADDIQTILDLYNQRKLSSDAQLRDAATILRQSKDPEVLILAHEMATLAFMEDRSNGALVRQTWTDFCSDIQRPRDGSPAAGIRAVDKVLK